MAKDMKSSSLELVNATCFEKRSLQMKLNEES